MQVVGWRQWKLLVVGCALSFGSYSCTDEQSPFSCEVDGCGEHGVCVSEGESSTCRCDTGYTGVDCWRCAEGYQDRNDDGICLPTCATLGCANGACSEDTGVAVCTCNAGFQDHDEDGNCAPDCATAGLTCVHGNCADDSGTAASGGTVCSQ